MLVTMYNRVFCVFALLAVSSAFAPQPFGMKRTTIDNLHMFNAENDKTSSTTTTPPLSETSSPQDANTVPTSLETKVDLPKNIVKDMNTGEIKEVKWVDPAMRANTNPFEMNWWGYILFGFPPILLLNDAFHFLPTEGPLSFLAKM
jgi:hypothetical protein